MNDGDYLIVNGGTDFNYECEFINFSVELPDTTVIQLN